RDLAAADGDVGLQLRDVQGAAVERRADQLAHGARLDRFDVIGGAHRDAEGGRIEAGDLSVAQGDGAGAAECADERGGGGRRGALKWAGGRGWRVGGWAWAGIGGPGWASLSVIWISVLTPVAPG